MSDIIGPLIQGGATLVGSYMTAEAQKKAGEQAAKVTNKTNAMQMELANTAHQREVRDLRAAGLNPLLSGTGGQGAQTPTLRPATQEAEGRGQAGQTMGNAMQALPSAILQFMTGQQQIELARANADKAEADAKLAGAQKTLADANTSKIQTETGWINKTNAQNIAESEQRVTESTQRTLESKAKTATIEVMRIPEVEHLLQQIAESSQRTKTEEQRTKELTQAANNAKELYGARAREATVIAAQAATYFKEFYLTHNKQLIDEKDLQIELLRNENFLKVIEGILKNEYGRALTWSEIMSTPSKQAAQLGAQIKGGQGPVVKPGR